MSRKNIHGSLGRDQGVGVSPVWVVSESCLRFFGTTTTREMKSAREVSIAEAMKILLQRPRSFLRDANDMLAWDYLRDLSPAGLTIQPVTASNIMREGRVRTCNTYLILPRVRDPRFVDLSRDYRLRILEPVPLPQ
jgi:hypothetical protein